MTKPRIVYYVDKDDELAGYINLGTGLIRINAFPGAKIKTVKETIDYFNNTAIHELAHWGSGKGHGKVHTDKKWTHFINTRILNKRK